MNKQKIIPQLDSVELKQSFIKTTSNYNTISLLIDSGSYHTKPKNKDIKSINSRIIKHPLEVTIQELATEITYPNGKTWIPARFKSKRSNEDWLSQQIFALDFDSGITFDGVLTRLNEYGLDCTFAYETFSSSIETPKFRVVWQLNEVVINNEYRKELQIQLMTLFPEADQSCKDAARLYFGGKGLLYENYDYYLDLPRLIDTVRCWGVRDSDKSKVSRDLKRLNIKISSNDEKMVKSGKPYIYNIEDSSFHPNKLLKLDFGKLREKVKILDDFMNGKWLYHLEIFGLATNLIHIHGGATLFKDCLNKNPKYTKDKYHLPSIAKYYNYQSMHLENFSPYEEDHIYNNLLQAYQQDIVRMSPYITMTLIEAENKFRQYFNLALESNDKDVYVFKVATGLGKTEAYLNLEGVTIALPNHALKDEIENRFKAYCSTTPNLPNQLSPEITNKLDYFYSIGAVSEVTRYLSNESKSSEVLKEYRDKNFSCYNSDVTVLTTHQKGLFINFKHDTLIFDEDPIQSILSINTTTINDFYRLKSLLDDATDIRIINAYLEHIEKGLLNSPIETKLVSFSNYESIEKIVLESNLPWDGKILQFFDSDFFVVDAGDKATIHFIRTNPLLDKKIIILSATANEFIYKKLLGDRLHFYDLSNVELTGMIEQDTKFSYSRHSFKQHLEQVVDKVGNLPTITFAKYKHNFPNAVEECHFGKTSGFDGLKGQDIAVVGLPHINHILYLLYAQVLDIKFKPSDFKMHYQKVKHNNIEFPIQTYDHEGLRQIQFFCIESEVRQAVGRARLLREPAKVLLLSGYPLPEACLTEEEKLTNKVRVNKLKEQKLCQQKSVLEETLALTPI